MTAPILIAVFLLLCVLASRPKLKRQSEQEIEAEIYLTGIRLEQAIERCPDYLLPFYASCITEFHNDKKGRIDAKKLNAVIGGLRAAIANRYHELNELHAV